MRPYKILVVDDDELFRQLLVSYLGDRGAAVSGVRDGAEALHQMSRSSYDVVLLDLMMPHMTGMDFLVSVDALVSDPSLPELPIMPSVVVMTSASSEAIPDCDIEGCFPRLVRAVLRKPVDGATLATHIERLEQA